MSKQFNETDGEDLYLDDRLTENDLTENESSESFSQQDESDSEKELEFEDTQWENTILLKWQISRLIDKCQEAEKKNNKQKIQILRLQRESMIQRKKFHLLESKMKSITKLLKE